MTGYVLDASALLAALFEEPGAELVEATINDACMSAVNLAEVTSRLVDRDTPEPVLAAILASIEVAVCQFDRAQAERAGRLRHQTRAQGLSLGDRACLALAADLNRIALTADAAWAKLEVDVEIELIR